MAFDQFKLDVATFQTRNIFNYYVYETNDTASETQAPNYFIQSRFANRQPEVWVGSIINCNCSDGFFSALIEANGILGLISGVGSVFHTFKSIEERDEFFGAPGNHYGRLLNRDLIVVNSTGTTATHFAWLSTSNPTSYDPAGWAVTSLESSSGSIEIGPHNSLGASYTARYVTTNSIGEGDYYLIREEFTDSGGSKNIETTGLGPSLLLPFPVPGVPGPNQSIYQYTQTPTNPGGALAGSSSFRLIDATIDFIVAPDLMLTETWAGLDTSVEPLFSFFFEIPGEGKHVLGPSGADVQEIIWDQEYTVRQTAYNADRVTLSTMQLQAVDIGGGVYQAVSDLRGSGQFPKIVLTEQNASEFLINQLLVDNDANILADNSGNLLMLGSN